MRFVIESWATEYGSAVDAEGLDPSSRVADVTVEIPAMSWKPIAPPSTIRPDRILFTDGVRRVDARVWVGNNGHRAVPGICASYAAGAVMCDGRAEVVATEVERGLFSAASEAEAICCRHATYPVRRPESDSPEALALALQQRMGVLETALAESQDADLVVVDGPLKGPRSVSPTIGYVKSHHVAYLPDECDATVAALQPGERTPIFLIPGAWSRFSWYLHLPGAVGHSWAGVVRCETSGDTEINDVIALANMSAGTLPYFASASHKDPRAPQNLYPIAGLERELRRRLGDQELLYRSLRVAAHAS